jgi:hypothetical protein
VGHASRRPALPAAGHAATPSGLTNGLRIKRHRQERPVTIRDGTDRQKPRYPTAADIMARPVAATGRVAGAVVDAGGDGRSS